MRKRVLFIYTERFSDFNGMIEQYEKEMRKLFEESRRLNGDFSKEAAETVAYKAEEPVYETEAEEEEKEGRIVVEVTTGRGAIPLSGVTVVIDRADMNDPLGRKELVAVRETNGSGKTDEVFVRAEKRALSLEPGEKDPFSTYYVSASEKGFVPVKNRPADVFADEVSILKIDLVPKAENLSAEEDVYG